MQNGFWILDIKINDFEFKWISQDQCYVLKNNNNGVMPSEISTQSRRAAYLL